MNKFINYGDYIFITFPQRKDDPFFLHGKSIIDPQLTSTSSKDLLQKGFRSCIFQVFPRNCQFLLDNLHQDNKTSTDPFQVEWKNFLHEEIQRHLGSPVLYGDSVHLLHLETRSFLCYEALPRTENSIQTYRLSLIQDISQEKTCFQFDTVSNYYYPGEKISYNTNILIKHSTTSNYLTFITESDAASQRSDETNPMIFGATPINELCMNPLPITLVQITQYSDPKKSRDFKTSSQILNGDYVRIYDLRLIRGNLAVHKFYLEQKNPDEDDKNGDLVLNYFKSNSSSTTSAPNHKTLVTENSNSLSALNVFQVINPDEIQKEEVPIKLYQRAPERGSKLRFLKKCYILKHALSSSFIQNLNSEVNRQVKLDVDPQGPIENFDKYKVCLFQLTGREESLIVNSNFLIGDYCTIREELLFIAQSIEEDPERVVKTVAYVDKNLNPEHNVMYYKDERLLAENYSTFALQWDRESNLSESLRCEKVSEDELYNLNFFMSARELLTSLNNELEGLRKIKDDHQTCFRLMLSIIERLKNMVMKILLFFTDKKLDGNYIYEESFLPSVLKQNYLREFHIIETINAIILKFTLLSSYFQNISVTKDQRFEELIIYLTYLLKLYMLNNPTNTNDLMRSVKIYLRSDLIPRLSGVVTEVLNHSEYASLNLIMEILKLFIYDKSSNNYTNYSPHSEISVKILKILFAASKFKSFCIALQRYRKFWSPQFIQSMFPKLLMNHSTQVLEVHYKNSHLMNLIDINSLSTKRNFLRFRPQILLYLVLFWMILLGIHVNIVICYLQRVKSETDLPLQADYVVSSFKFITILAKKLPNFQRLYTTLKDFIPYDACLAVVQYSDNEVYSFATKKLMLDLIFNFHFKYALTQQLHWPYQFIKASNVNLPSSNSDEKLTEEDQKILASVNRLPQKLTLVNIYNQYNRKLRSLMSENYNQKLDTFEEIYNILQFCCIFFKNDIIEFPDKRIFLVQYHGYCDLNLKLEQHVQAASTRLTESENLILYKIRSLLKEIQTDINQAIETFFTKEFLLFLRQKYQSNPAEQKPPANMAVSMITGRIKPEGLVRQDSFSSMSSSQKLPPSEKPSPIKRRVSVPSMMDPGSSFEDFIVLKLDDYKYEEDLREFLEAWDATLEPYSLSQKKIIEDQLRYMVDTRMEPSYIVLLEKLASRFKSLVQQLKNFVILENNTEILEIAKVFNSLKHVSETIEGFAKENNISADLFDDTEQQLQDVLHQLGIDIQVIKDANLSETNILNFLLENQHIFDIKYDRSRQKYQDSMRILKLHESLLDILDYFITSTNDYYMPRTLKGRLYIILILLFFISNHSLNCQLIHKLLVTAYFYEVYSGKIYSPDVVIYMQILLSNLFKYSPDLLRNENEVKRLLQLFYEPYLRNIIDLNYKPLNSPIQSPLKSPKSYFSNRTSPRRSPCKDISHLIYSHLPSPNPQSNQSNQSHRPQPPTDSSSNPIKVQPVSASITPATLSRQLKLEAPRSSTPIMDRKNPLSSPTDPKSLKLNPALIAPIQEPVMERISSGRFQATLVMCTFALNSIQAFFKTKSRPIQAKFQGHLQDLFHLNYEVFTDHMILSDKAKFDNEELESVWLRFYQSLLKTCIEFAHLSHVMQHFLVSTFDSFTNLNKLLLKIKNNYSYGLKIELIQLATLLYSNFGPTEENTQAKIEFLFIIISEVLLFFDFQSSQEHQPGEESLSKEKPNIQKVKSLKIWQDIKETYGVDLLKKVQQEISDPASILELLNIQNLLQHNVFSTILKFFNHLFKYHTPFCLTQLDYLDGTKIAIMDILMGILHELLETSKSHGQEEKVGTIKTSLLHEVKTNKDFGKFHHQMKVIDFLLQLDPTPRKSSHDASIVKMSKAGVATVFEATIEKFLSEDNIKNLSNTNLNLLVKSIEEHPLAEKVLQQILNIVQNEQYSDLPHSSYSFFCYLMRELVKDRILKLQERQGELESLTTLHIKIEQRMFIQFQFPSFVFQNMVNCPDEDLLIFIEMANLLLYGGYDKMQRSFYECFMSDHENRLMLRLSAQLKTISEKFLRKEKIRNSANQMLLFKKKLKLDHLKHKDDTEALLLSNILKFINLLCENHNRDFQQFFKEQNHANKLNSISINFPIELCVFINSYIDICNYYSYSIGHQLFGALIEIVQGDSRDIIFEICNRTTIINDILFFLTKYQSGTDLFKGRRFEGNNVMENLKSDAICLLLSITESSDLETKQIIAQEINYSLLIKATTGYINDFFKKNKLDINQQHIQNLLKIRDEDFLDQGGLSDCLNLLIVVKVLQRSSGLFKKELAAKIKECEPRTITEFEFYMNELSNRFIKSIEIVDKNKDLRKIYFNQLPSCFYLDQNIKDHLLERIDRTTYHVKISEFVSDVTEIQYKMNNKMKSALNPYLTYLNKLYPKLKSYSYSLAYIINILIMLYFPNEDLDIIYNDTYLNLNSYFYVFLNFVQLVFSLSMFIVWFTTSEPMFHLVAEWTKFKRVNAKKVKLITYEEEQRWNLRPDTITTEDFIRILKLRGPNSVEFNDPVTNGLNIPEVRYEYLKYTIKFLFKSGSFINNLAYVINCWLSLVVHPIFCSLQLLSSLLESRIMQGVIKSFYKNAREMGITMGGSVIIIFIYSLVGYFFLRESFIVSDYENICTSIWHCFISLLIFGMRSGGGGIGDSLMMESYINGNRKMYTARWFYDISFFFLIIVVMLNLIFGIVIDTFGSIRSEEIENKEDQKGKCFICDIDRGMLERMGSGFEEHTANEHHMWNYIFYLVHIKVKKLINLSEIENYVYDCVKNKDYTWVPYKKALCMRGRGGEEDDLEKDINYIKEIVSQIESRIEGGVPTANLSTVEKKEKRAWSYQNSL